MGGGGGVEHIQRALLLFLYGNHIMHAIKGGYYFFMYVSTHSLVNLTSLKRRRWGTFYFMNLLKLVTL
jgi:hypothetical protein